MAPAAFLEIGKQRVALYPQQALYGPVFTQRTLGRTHEQSKVMGGNACADELTKYIKKYEKSSFYSAS
jgi:hypothetical protein